MHHRRAGAESQIAAEHAGAELATVQSRHRRTDVPSRRRLPMMTSQGECMDQTPAAAERQFTAESRKGKPEEGFSPTPVVGLGGSAGSIPALGRFLEGVTVPSGLVYVVILHLSPDHE